MIMESSGEEDISMVIIEHQEEFEYPHPKAETSPQMDRKSEATDTFGISHCSVEEGCIREKEATEENNSKETVPMELSSSLPIVMADCVKVVFAAVPEPTNYAEAGEDAISYMESESRVELQPSPAVVNEVEEVIPEAAIDLHSLVLEPIPTTPQQPAADNVSSVEEELITATVFAPLFGEQEARPTVPEEPVEATIISSEDEEVKGSMRQPKTEMLASIPETAEDEDTEEEVQETVEAVLKATEEEIITEEAGCNLATCDEAAPEIIAEGQAEGKAEDESTTNLALDSQSADTEDLLVRLQVVH